MGLVDKQYLLTPFYGSRKMAVWAEARAGIGAYLRFYNSERPHQTLDYRTPAQVFEEGRNQVHQSEVSLTPELVPA